MPGQIQTFLNPLAYVPAYVLIQALPPVVASAALAALHALNVVLLFVLARQALLPRLGADASFAVRATVLGSAVLIGITAPMFLGELGTTFADISTSVLCLAGLILVCGYLKSERAVLVVVAGLAFGVATGLKLTNGPYLVAALVCACWLAPSWSTVLKSAAWLGLGAGIGLLLTHGFWSALLMAHFGSPLFPFYNEIFRSPFFPPLNFVDARFIP